MDDFYQKKSQSYFNSTAFLDSTSILTPVASALPPGASVLDVGCGSGRDLRWLKDHGFKPTGFEKATGLATLAREFSGCTVFEGDFFTFDFTHLTFDSLILVGALVHVERPLFSEVLKRISAALVDGGLIYITLKEGTGKRAADDGRTFTLWSQEQLKLIFQKLDFRVNDFSRQVSKLRSSDVWLGYLLSHGERNDSR